MSGKHHHEDGKPAYGSGKSARDSKYGLPVPDGLRKPKDTAAHKSVPAPTKPLPHKLAAEKPPLPVVPKPPAPPKHGGVHHTKPANPLLKNDVKKTDVPLYTPSAIAKDNAHAKPKPGTVQAADKSRVYIKKTQQKSTASAVKSQNAAKTQDSAKTQETAKTQDAAQPPPKSPKHPFLDNAPKNEEATAPIHSTQALSALEQRPEPTREEAEQLRREREIIKSKLKRQDVFRMSVGTITGIILVTAIIGISALLSWVIVTSAIDFVGIEKDDYDIEVEIPVGASTEQIAKILQNNKIITKPDLFVRYSKMTDKDGKYLHGLFTLSSTMSYNRIIYNLQNTARSTVTVSVRIQEGMTGDDISALLEENGVCKAADFEYFYRMKLNDYNFEKRVNQDNMKYNQLEGYLFPDTYEFYVVEGFDDLAAREKMNTYDYAAFAASKIYANFNEKITVDMYRRISEMNMSLDQFMTLSSMVQKEASEISDMRKVASVFLNRLQNSSKFPLLQSDVTELYAEKCIKSHLTERNIDYYKPILDAYDTYVTPGLPPGPVCNPGMDALKAVLNAEDTDYFYFNANTETGEVFFASDLAEHEANLEKVKEQQAVSVG